MATVPHLASLSAISDATQTAEEFSFALRDFLDGFYPDPQATKLSDEPRLLRDCLDDGGYADAYLAAAAEFLAEKHSLPLPRWALDPKRVLSEPHFAFKTDEGRIFLLMDSPAAFRTRNIFVSADALSRV